MRERVLRTHDAVCRRAARLLRRARLHLPTNLACLCFALIWQWRRRSPVYGFPVNS